MAIARKPALAAALSPVDVDELINRGGAPANGGAATAAKAAKSELRMSVRKPVAPNLNVTPVILRIPNERLDAIDASVGLRAVRTPRHTWLLEAIEEKLERER